MTKKTKSAIEDQIAALQGLSRDELLLEWMKRYGAVPYKGIRETSLIRGIVYHMQAKTLGNLRSVTSKKLLKLAEGDIKPIAKRAFSIQCDKPRTQLGSRLVREWNGRTYEVLVADKGYVLNGVTHRSLSSCAKAITGAQWSGPRFFGVAS